MISNYTFLEIRIQPLHDGLFFVQKVLSMPAQRVLEMSRRLYTGEYLKQNNGRKSLKHW